MPNIKDKNISKTAISDTEWLSILSNTPLRDMYIVELYFLALSVVNRTENIFSKTPPPLPGKSYLIVSPEIHSEIYAVLSEAIKIKSLLIPRCKLNKQSIQVRRADWLSTNILKGVKLSEILNADVRNSLEHFDEYIDATIIKCQNNIIAKPVNIASDLIAWDEAVLSHFKIGGEYKKMYPLRVYLVKERTILNCDYKVNVGLLHDEALSIKNTLTKTFPVQEKGGVIFVVVK